MTLHPTTLCSCQVQETISRGRAPSLKNFAAQYRDPEPHAIWKATCLFVAAIPRATEVYGVHGVLELKDQFRKGLLDTALVDKARAADKSLDFDDLSYIRKKIQGSMVDWSPGRLDRAMNAAEEAKANADFEWFVAELQNEQVLVTNYWAEKNAQDDRVQSDITAARELADRAKEEAMAAHLGPYFAVEALPERGGIRAYLQGAYRRFHEAPPRTAEEHGLQFHVINLAALGVHHSLLLGELVATVREQCTLHPKTTGVLVVLNNTPVWGKNLKPRNPGWEEAVEEAKQEATSAFTQHRDLKVRRIVGKFNSQAMYSAERELSVEFLMVLSAEESSGVLVSVYSRSPVWLRKAFAQDLEALPRSSFQHYTEAFLRKEHGNLDVSVELRQWHCGAAFWDAIITAIHSGPLGSEALICQVREFYPYDPEMGKAILYIRARCSSKQPGYGYVGVQVRDHICAFGGKNIVEHIKEALAQYMSQLVDAGSYKMPGYAVRASASSGVLVTANSGPAPPVLKHTAMRDRELPLLQAVHDKWDAIACTRARWDVACKNHNESYNRSGVPFKLRRGPEELLETKEEAQAVTIANPEGTPPSKEALQATLLQAMPQHNLGSLRHITDIMS